MPNDKIIVCVQLTRECSKTASCVIETVQNIINSIKFSEKPERIKIFENLGCFSILASPAYIKELVIHSDVEKIMVNQNQKL